MHVEKEGIYYGQCSEICGKDHAFMPLGFKVVSREVFNEWVREQTAGDFDGDNPPKLLEIAPVEMADAASAQ
ncbi:MAG: hypothetical protein Alpg2KO_23820 [Alphaproteobacteria bacterium]